MCDTHPEKKIKQSKGKVLRRDAEISIQCVRFDEGWCVCSGFVWLMMAPTQQASITHGLTVRLLLAASGL